MLPRSQLVVILITGWRLSSVKTGVQMIGCWKIAAIGSVLSEERSKWVDGIYPLYSDSLYPCCDQPITSLATISPLLSWPIGRIDPKTHTGTGTIVLFLCHDSHDPLCLWIYVLCLASFFVTIISYCIFLLWSWQFCLLSAPLWFHCLHILYCYLFLASGLCTDPVLNRLGI